MKLSSKEKIIYLAGIIDGEGCITISRRPPWHDSRGNARSHSYHIRLEIVNTNLKLINFLKKEFNGSIYKRKPTSKKAKIAYDLRFTSKEALKIFNQVEPFLIVKKKQCQLSIKFQNHIYSTISKGHCTGPGNRVKKMNIKFRDRIWLQIKELNKRGV